MEKLFNMTRVEETAQFIAGELTTILSQSDINSHMSRSVRESCSAYHNGLTNGERLIATSQALAMVQLKIIADLAEMNIEKQFDDA
jgi:hypothetical protein